MLNPSMSSVLFRHDVLVWTRKWLREAIKISWKSSQISFGSCSNDLSCTTPFDSNLFEDHNPATSCNICLLSFSFAPILQQCSLTIVDNQILQWARPDHKLANWLQQPIKMRFWHVFTICWQPSPKLRVPWQWDCCIQVCKFLLKMQHMKWYEWVRCGSWHLQGCDLGYKTVWPIIQWKTRSSTSMKARMNFGTGTSECWAESLNGSWQMRWPACFMRIWNRRSQKDLRRSYPSHVQVLLFVKPDPGHAIGEEPAAFVGTGTCGHSQLKVSTKADIWSLQRLAWLSRLSTLSELYTPQKQVWDLTSWKHDTTCEASICLVNC